MANEQNLRKLTTTQAREIGKLGGIASAKSKAKKKTIRELAIIFGQTQLQDEGLRKTLRKNGIDADQLTNDMAMVFGLTRRAQAGDSKAAKLLLEMRGEYSTRVEVEPVQPKPLIDLTEGKK